MAELDIFNRTLKCIDIVKEEAEEYPSPSVSVIIPEEEEMRVEEEEKAERDVMRELECLKRQIQKLQLILKARMKECPDEECVDLGTELNCSEKREVCALQKGQFKVQCQIKDLVRCCNLAKDQIAELRVLLCEKVREILALQKSVGKLESWRLQLEHEFGVCRERCAYLTKVKAEWRNLEQKMDAQFAFLRKEQKKHIKQVAFIRQKKEGMYDIRMLMQMCDEMIDMQNELQQEITRKIAIFKSKSPASNGLNTVEEGLVEPDSLKKIQEEPTEMPNIEV